MFVKYQISKLVQAAVAIVDELNVGERKEAFSTMLQLAFPLAT